MWVKKSPEELAVGTCLIRSMRALLVFLFTASMIAFLRAGNVDHPNQLFNPSYLIVQNIPTALFFGIIGALVFYYIDFRNEKKCQVLVCSKCEKVKDWDGIIPCDCGGQFEDIRKLKWVEIPKPKPNEHSQK
jgi:hypothetical protein